MIILGMVKRISRAFLTFCTKSCWVFSALHESWQRSLCPDDKVTSFQSLFMLILVSPSSTLTNSIACPARSLLTASDEPKLNPLSLYGPRKMMLSSCIYLGANTFPTNRETNQVWIEFFQNIWNCSEASPGSSPSLRHKPFIISKSLQPQIFSPIANEICGKSLKVSMVVLARAPVPVTRWSPIAATTSMSAGPTFLKKELLISQHKCFIYLTSSGLVK